MYRVSRVDSTRLFKYVAKVDIKFNPYDQHSASVRELWRRLSSPKLKRSNPKCDVSIKMLDTATRPSTSMTFVDGSQTNLEDTSKMNVAELLSEMHMGAATIENAWVMEGRDLDDES